MCTRKIIVMKLYKCTLVSVMSDVGYAIKVQSHIIYGDSVNIFNNNW